MPVRRHLHLNSIVQRFKMLHPTVDLPRLRWAEVILALAAFGLDDEVQLLFAVLIQIYRPVGVVRAESSARANGFSIVELSYTI